MPRLSWKTERARERAQNVTYKTVKVSENAGYTEEDGGIRVTAWPKLSAFEEMAVDVGHKEPVYIDVRITWKQLAETMARHWNITRARRHK